MRSLRSQASSPLAARQTDVPVTASPGGSTRRIRTAMAVQNGSGVGGGGRGGHDAFMEVHESIEAKATPPDDTDAEADADADGEADPDIEMTDAVIDVAAGGGRSATSSRPPRDSRDLLQLIDTTANFLRGYEENGQEIALGFNRIPNKRLLPDYFDVIKEPVAFSTIRGKVQKKQYANFSQFVRDIALICHNAQVYNRPSAPIFQDAVRLQAVAKEKLQELVRDGSIGAEEAELPDLGEIPDFSPSPEPEEGNESGEDEDEGEDEDGDNSDDDEDEEDEEEDDGSGGRGNSRRGGGQGARMQSKHGRPPRLLTPLEARISEVLRGLRRMQDEDGDKLTEPFETLPDRAQLPEYYEEIKQPMALDIVRRRLRRKQYGSVEQAIADVELMCSNAQRFNEDGSAIFEAAVALQQRARELAAQQMARPDSDFRDPEGRLPLTAIPIAGGSGSEAWRVGDWVHLRNPNDPGKPTVAQIFRTWADASGGAWISACWYFRPEQTVHRFDKHFIGNEVFRTSQFHTHRVADIVGRCFVMFAPRFAVGRPRGLPPSIAVYVCAARYNEVTCRFRYIAPDAWPACLPDELRDAAAAGTDYALDLFPAPQPLRHLPSPIKHLLREDARETDPLPKPTWGNPNAPPMVGAVHRRPRLPNESPPSEYQLPAQGLPTEMQLDPPRQPAYLHPGVPAGPGPSPSPHAPYAQQQFVPRPQAIPVPPSAHLPPQHQQAIAAHPTGPQPPLPRGGHPLFVSHLFDTRQPGHQPQPQPGPPPELPPTRNFSSISSNNNMMQPHAVPPQQQQTAAVGMPQVMTPKGGATAFDPRLQQQQMLHNRMVSSPVSSGRGLPATPAATAAAVPTPLPPSGQPTPTGYIPPRPTAEAFVLPADVDSSIPAAVRKHYHCDSQGRVMFFTAPSVRHADTGQDSTDADDDAAAVGLAPEFAGLGHSVRYLHGLEDFREERRRKRKARDEALAEEARAATEQQMHDHEETVRLLYGAAGEALGGLVQWMNEGTRAVDASLGGWQGPQTASKKRAVLSEQP